MNSPIFPSPLRLGDRIAIVSPAGIINPDYVDGAMSLLQAQGWDPYVTPHALGRQGSYSGTCHDRLTDIAEALADNRTRAILCSRGGYGAVHLLDSFPVDLMLDDPRWLIGFSDISVLHAIMSANGIVSIHAPMCKHLSSHGTDTDSLTLFDILRGHRPQYNMASDTRSITGQATGPVVGGNLAVLQALISTPYDVLSRPGTILLVEDIAEPIYKIERIFYQLQLCGILDHINGLILGQFTEYTPDRNHNDVYEAILPLVADKKIPVAVNFPAGHVDHNMPIPMSAVATLNIDDKNTTLAFY